jgi:hypothetical protein
MPLSAPRKAAGTFTHLTLPWQIRAELNIMVGDSISRGPVGMAGRAAFAREGTWWQRDG